MAQSAESGVASIFFWGMVLIGFVALMFAAVTYLRRWVRQTDTTTSPGFTLGDLRELRRKGQITDEEYERARAKIVAATQAAAARAAARDAGAAPGHPTMKPFPQPPLNGGHGNGRTTTSRGFEVVPKDGESDGRHM